MDATFVQRLSTELINFDAGDAQAIIAGIDETGPHLWVMCNDDLSCCDKVGFAAIGAGENHAKSQFMLAQHTRYSPFAESLLLTFTAKRRSEIAPGVGNVTDMFMVGPQENSFAWIGDHVLKGLNEIYQHARTEEQRIIADSEERVNKYVQEITASANAKEQATLPETIDGSAPIDQRQIRGGNIEGAETGEEAPELPEETSSAQTA